MGKIQKESKWVNCLNLKSFNHLLFIAFSSQKEAIFISIVTGDENWIYYDNFKRKKSWIGLGQSSTSTSKRNGNKVLLCIWWDIKCVVYYELLKANLTVAAERYQQQLNVQ